MTHNIPMGVVPIVTPDPLENALAFQAQAIARLAEAKMVECVTRYFTRGQKSVAVETAASAVLAAANTLDAANQELAETLRDLIKERIMTALAAVEKSA